MSGTLYGVGTAGYSWAATITDADAYRLDFYHLGIIPHSSYYRANGFPLRCLQEEVRPKAVLLAWRTRKLWLRKPQQNALWACRAAPGRRLRENDTHRVSDGESGGPPARGGVGPGDPTGRSCSAYSPLTNHQQRKFVLGRGTARGGGGSRDSSSRNFLTDRPIPIGYPKNCSAQQLLAARLGDSFYFAKSEIVESLLRHGARVPLGTRKLELARQQAKTALTPGGRCLPAHGRGLPVATCIVRALAENNKSIEAPIKASPSAGKLPRHPADGAATYSTHASPPVRCSVRGAR